MVYEFNAQGQLVRLGNRKGQFLSLTYNGAGQLSQVTEPVSGVFLSYAYNSQGLLESVSNNLGHQAVLTYKENRGQTTFYFFLQHNRKTIRLEASVGCVLRTIIGMI